MLVDKCATGTWRQPTEVLYIRSVSNPVSIRFGIISSPLSLFSLILVLVIIFNRFSALSKPEEENRRGYSAVSPARGEGRGRGGGFGQPPRMVARLSQEQEREKAIAAAK